MFAPLKSLMVQNLVVENYGKIPFLCRNFAIEHHIYQFTSVKFCVGLFLNSKAV